MREKRERLKIKVFGVVSGEAEGIRAVLLLVGVTVVLALLATGLPLKLLQVPLLFAAS